jgi:hypothetical protein
MLQIMQHEITTAEAAELFDVTRKTIALWAQSGVMVKLRHGVYDLKKSLKNWVSYQQCIFERADDPLALWEIRQQIAWSEAHPRPPFDLENTVLLPLGAMRTFELDASGRVIGEAKG